jgi:hypothetical protein
MAGLLEPPDGIVITISAGMLKERGYCNWLRNFLNAMHNHERLVYYMRQGAKPKHDIRFVYLCIGNKVRYRAYFAGTEGPKWMEFRNVDGSSKLLFARAWILLCGPVVKAPFDVPMKGFQGFRYTKELF